MKQIWLGVLVALLTVGGLWIALGHDASPPSAFESVTADPVVLPVEVPEAPQASEEPPALPTAAEPPLPAVVERPIAAALAGEEPPSEPPPAAELVAPSLEALMRVPGVPPREGQDVGWAGKRSSSGPTQTTRKPRARIDYSREKLTEGVPLQDERRRTDVGVSVPMDEKERLRVKGGVRVDERDGADAETESEATPTVGVEVKF